MEVSPRKTRSATLKTPKKSTVSTPGHSVNTSPLKKRVTSPKRLLCSPKKYLSPKKAIATPATADFCTPRKSAPSVKLSQPNTPVRLRKSTPKKDIQQEILCERDDEIATIRRFVETHYKDELPGSLYISGKPGTGKTACVNDVLAGYAGEKYYVNCMGIEDPKTIYSQLVADITGQSRNQLPQTPSRHKLFAVRLEKMLCGNYTDMKLIVLDEIDQLRMTTNLEILHQVFLWPTLKNSRVILIGISNLLDFTNQLISKLRFPRGFEPESLEFKPYSADQLNKILDKKLEKISIDEGCSFDKVATKLCAMKTAASSGDIRMAFSICRRGARSAAKQKNETENSTENEPLKELGGKRKDFEVKISHIHSVLTEHAAANDTGKLPLQQRLIVCCVLVMLRSKKPINIGSLADKYADICPSQGLPGLSPADIVDLCDILSSLGVLHVKREKLVRQSKVSLKLAAEDAISSFVGKPLMDSILSS
ncbi:hypothetical protein RvY_09335 [Ramazzottius varieornatus]|uniref:Cell division control protein n=1 Tax=Ramazzottius varieornatus TaxID=947166 RepID=A0A1D1VBF9_RAMVA|nr:hypothetical protein RvY_09335 [Ramazzottius varieornatus]